MKIVVLVPMQSLLDDEQASGRRWPATCQREDLGKELRGQICNILPQATLILYVQLGCLIDHANYVGQN